MFCFFVDVSKSIVEVSNKEKPSDIASVTFLSSAQLRHERNIKLGNFCSISDWTCRSGDSWTILARFIKVGIPNGWSVDGQGGTRCRFANQQEFQH